MQPDIAARLAVDLANRVFADMDLVGRQRDASGIAVGEGPVGTHDDVAAEPGEVEREVGGLVVAASTATFCSRTSQP